MIIYSKFLPDTKYFTEFIRVFMAITCLITLSQHVVISWMSNAIQLAAVK